MKENVKFFLKIFSAMLLNTIIILAFLIGEDTSDINTKKICTFINGFAVGMVIVNISNWASIDKKSKR